MSDDDIDSSKRDFLGKATATVGGVGVVATSGMFVSSMLPTRDVSAQATVEVDISDIPEGSGKTVEWQGSPVFVIHRTAQQIDSMRDSQGVKDPQPDKERVKRPEWLVLVGTCTHMGCVPNMTDQGWFCPCHGSKYDMSGRILSGPAPRNLDVPPYQFVDDKTLVIGEKA